ncbi:Uncharacterized conserved protein YqhQ [Desulfonispora thiosulfatigenes DSM 11270]|uniref:Uncharacterized conserved protein YqhQ n=1 Tax=Desulfonispora thiosulfatigenes DSM 11270 TaxID=656914 RepID=A0A1W1V528_DESTI|nr:DUF1385 domain-containing protein [Desulfonispora thiosulfatigenes]SMB88131.1 Uncharacterized conserved protein YqhQ [Desulfonispora thiosulfatigenes DSM 11270]
MASYGGQALIEGVMMRGQEDLAIAVRKSDNEISCKMEKITGISAKYPFLKKPFLRGTVALFESLIMGIKALTYSANESVEAEEEELSNLEIAFSIALALGLGILLFFIAPAVFAHLLHQYVQGSFLQNVLEGFMRIGIFLLYVFGISRMKDIQRVFEYHGAEHKVIHAYEAGEELKVENCRKYTTLHPRCGTSFLLIVMVISILIFSLFGVEIFWWRLLSRVILLPVIAGVSYEILKLAGKYCDNPIMKIVNKPGLMMQKLTTGEPDDSQLEVALRALQGVLDAEKGEDTCKI